VTTLGVAALPGTLGVPKDDAERRGARSDAGASERENMHSCLSFFL